MSNVKCLIMLKYMFMLECEMLKPCSLFPMPKLGTRPLLKLLDDDNKGTVEAWL